MPIEERSSLMRISVEDPDLELRGGGGWVGAVLIYLSCRLFFLLLDPPLRIMLMRMKKESNFLGKVIIFSSFSAS